MLVADPVVAKQIVQDEAHKWVKEGTAFFPGSSLAGNGLLVSDGAIWRRQRRLSNPAFRRASVRDRLCAGRSRRLPLPHHQALVGKTLHSSRFIHCCACTCLAPGKHWGKIQRADLKTMQLCGGCKALHAAARARPQNSTALHAARRAITANSATPSHLATVTAPHAYSKSLRQTMLSWSSMPRQCSCCTHASPRGLVSSAAQQ